MLKLKVVDLKEGKIYFKVEKQIYRCKEFFCGTDTFVSKKIFQIRSKSIPSVCRIKDKVLYVRGAYSSKLFDERILEVDVEDYKNILEAVKEYNSRVTL